MCSCVGPIIDVQMKLKVFIKEKLTCKNILYLFDTAHVRVRDVFLPSVYDALLILRPSCNFRDGAVIRNVIVNFRSYLSQLPFNDCYLLGLIHVLPTCPSKYHSFYKCLSFEAREINTRDIMLGFTSLFLFIKSYANCLIAEINQLCYKGVLRTVTLGSTNGLCTWRCSSIIVGGVH